MNPAKIFASPGWDRILSYLTLADLERLSDTHSELRKIRGNYLGKGNRLTIDRDTLLEFPIETNKKLYSSYGSRATNIAIEGVFPSDAVRLFPLFPKMRELSLKNVQIEGEKSVKFTAGLTKLRLSNANVGKRWLNKFKLLETLILHETEWTPVNFPHLKSLTLIDVNYIHGHRLPNVKELTVDCLWNCSYQEISKLQQLEYLKIIQSVDPKLRGEIEALNLKTVDVHYFDIPTEDTPIKRLNEDCFLHLCGLLSPNDWISLRDTLWCLQEQKIPKFTVNKQTLKRRPLSLYRPFYERIGPFVTQLKIHQINSKDVCKLLPFFVNLNHLTLSLPTSDKEIRFILKNIPVGLKWFKLDINQYEYTLPQPEFTELMRRLNPTLETLNMNRLNDGSTQSLKELQNIRDFECFQLECTKPLLSFLNSNTHMRRLVCSFETNEIGTDFWSKVVQMNHLEILDISGEDLSFPILSRGSLPSLKKLTLYNSMPGKQGIHGFLSSLDGSDLTNLEILNFLFEPFQDLVQCILRFRNLRTLQHYNIGGAVLPVIKGLPLLVKLATCSDVSVGVLRELDQYLRQTKRRFKLSTGKSNEFCY